MAAFFVPSFAASILCSIPKISRFYHSSATSDKPMKVSMSRHQTSWATINSEVDSYIENALSGRQPASVFDPMNHLIFQVPRSMAPALCIAACEAVGGDKEDAISAASALHLMHVSTYTHEYLQLSDQLVSMPMIKHPYGPNIELLISDSMVPLGFELLASSTTNSDPRILDVMVEIAHSVGSQGMVYGQYVKLKWLGLEGGEPFKDGSIVQAFEKKGGELYSCGAACGAILGGGSDEEIEKLRRFGLYVGMIHNIMVHDGVGRDKRLIKLANSLRFLALKELEGMKDKNIEHISSIIEGFSAFLRVQKYQFPQRL